MAWPLARIVDSLDKGRVLFDFNPGRSSDLGRWLTKQEASPLGEPTWDSSVLGVVEGVRTLKLPLRFTGRQAEPAMAVLSEILTRTMPTYLQFQTRQDAEPMWFRLHRQTAGGAPDFTQMFPGDVENSAYQWTVSLDADAFALGAREYLTPTTELAQAGESIMAPVEIPDQIKGQAPAPLNLEIDGGDLSGYQTQLMSWAMDPAMSVAPWAGSSNLGLTFSGSSSYEDIGGLPQTPPPGQYRCLLYVTRTTTGSGSAKFRVGASSGVVQTVYTPWKISAPSSGNIAGRWIDCGRLNLPPGMDFADLAEDELPDLDFVVSFNGDGSASTWTVTNFTLIPVATVMSRAATTVLASQWGYMGDSVALRIDGERNRAGMVDISTRKWAMTAPPVVDGFYPRVHPGARNFLMFLPRMNPIAPHNDGTSGETTMWYYPRYLHVGAR